MKHFRMFVMFITLTALTSCKTILTSEIPLSKLFSGGTVEVVSTSVCYVGKRCDNGVSTVVDVVDVINHKNKELLGDSDVGFYYSEKKTLMLYLSKRQIDIIFDEAHKHGTTRRDVEIKFTLLNDSNYPLYITLSGAWVDGTPVGGSATTFEIPPYEGLDIQLSDTQTWYWLASGILGVGTIHR